MEMTRAMIIFNYVMANFKLKYEVGEDLLKIDYGIDTGAKIRINNSGSGFFDQPSKVDLKSAFYHEWKEIKIPFLFGDSVKQLYTSTDSKYEINADIIASTFYFLSCWQEQFAVKNDRFNRFTYKESIQKELNITLIPVVNYYFDILKSVIEECYNVRLAERIKGNFTVNLSHDIDELDTLWLQEGYHALKKGKLVSLPAIVLEKLKLFNKTDPSLSRILGFERSNKLQSDFFFLCRRGMDGLFKNADYDIKGEGIAEASRQIIQEGNEIGVHGSFHTHYSVDKLTDDIKTLESVTGHKVKGNRFHFLSYDCMITPSVLQSCGINYDSTLGFAEHIGFRNGYANAFYLFDIQNFKSTSVIEFPLSLMDASLYFPQYMHTDYEQSFEAVKKLITEIEKVNGLLVINWHNTGYLQYKNNWLQPLLTDIINECRKRQGVFVKMSEVCNLLSDEKAWSL